jgi:Asp-tRNA(Asn)/Glu-tRNA(Gln) amidotransferase A subunit family amidase
VDAGVVTKLREAGALVLGKTYMPTDGKTPPTRNPYNQEHTAGGTSSGSGAAVGARQVPICIGEQTMGSNLRPAAYCGLSGMKPTYGRISRYGCFPFAWSVDHVGLIGLSMEDLALVLSCVAGPDPLDRSTIQEPPPPADLRLSEMRPPRLGFVRNFFFPQAEPPMQAAVEKAAASLRAAGADVRDLDLPKEFELTWQAQRLITASEGATFHAMRHPDKDLSGSAGRSGALIPATYYLQARRWRNWFVNKLREEVFSQFDAILMPATPAAAPKGFQTGNANFLVPFSMMGLPAITTPAALSPEGLPLGLELVAAPREDYNLLRVGAWCEGIIERIPLPDL